jgi:hypothetical protein
VRHDHALRAIVRVVARFAVVTGLGLLASPAAAEIYRWTDEAGHSHYAEGLDSVPEQFRAWATPLGLRNAPALSPRTSTRRQGPSGGAWIRFTPGERIMVDARVNGSHSVRLLLDTGADRTLISPRALVAAGVSLTRGSMTGSISGVTGTADVQAVALDSLEVGEARVGRLRVISYDMNQSGYDGLLGRDFLEQFNVSIDSSRGLVSIAPRR